MITASWILSAVAGAAPGAQGTAPGWEVVAEADGITTYRATRSDERVMPMRAVATIDQHVSVLLGLFLDSSHTTEWAERLVELEVHPTDDPQVAIEWQRYHTGFPFADRDF